MGIKSLGYLTISLFLWSASEGQSFGFGKPEHSVLKIQMNTTIPKATEFSFQVVPNQGMKATLEAPWKLSIDNNKGVLFATKELSLDKLIQGSKTAPVDPSFELVSTKPLAKVGSFDYRVVSFICTKDQTRCYREVHKGRYNWPLDSERDRQSQG